MDEGLELAGDGFVLRPKQSGYRESYLVGLLVGLMGAFIIGLLIDSLRRSERARLWPEWALVGGVALFMGFLTWLGWFLTRPPTLTVNSDELSLVGGPYRRRVRRAQVKGVYRGLETGAEWPEKPGKAYFVILETPRAVRIPTRHFVPAGLDEAMRRLGVPIKGDFTRIVSEFKLGDLFFGPETK